MKPKAKRLTAKQLREALGRDQLEAYAGRKGMPLAEEESGWRRTWRGDQIFPVMLLNLFKRGDFEYLAINEPLQADRQAAVRDDSKPEGRSHESI